VAVGTRSGVSSIGESPLETTVRGYVAKPEILHYSKSRRNTA
jgi:hypothetical protein